MNAIARGLRVVGEAATELPPFDPGLVEHFRNLVSLALCYHTMPRSDMLTNLQITCAKGERLLRRSSGTYTITDAKGDQIVKQKPSWAQWVNEVHASEGRKPGYSRELMDEEGWRQAQKCRVLFSLSEKQVAAISARAHPELSQRRVAQQFVLDLVSEQYSDEKAIWLARTYFTIHNYDIDRVYHALGMSMEAWRNSRLRRAYADIRKFVEEGEAAALYHWAMRCETAGLTL